MKPKQYNMNILDKYKDHMDKSVYDKYTWIIFFIQTMKRKNREATRRYSN